MKKILIPVIVFWGLSLSAQVQVAWYNYPNGVAVANDASDNVYTAYWEYNPGGDITLTKRSSDGNVLWQVPYNNTNNTRHEVATWVATDNDGNILVSGTIRSGYSNPVNANSLLMKYNPSGTLLWRVVYEADFDGSSTRKCLVDVNNNIYVLGIGTGPNGQVTKVKKFNSAGNTVWNYFDSGIGAPLNFKFTPDNKILIIHRGVTGSINGFSKIDLDGNNIWSVAGIVSLSAGDAAGDASGNTYIINGATQGSVLKKLSPTGTTLWSQANSVNGNKVEVGTDNNPVVAGYPATSYGVVMLKYDSNGTLLWQNLDADGPSLALLAIAPLKLDASNSAYIAGSTMSQMGLCKVNSDGSSAWAATTPSGYPVSFVFGADNSVYLTGGTTAKFIQSGTVNPPQAPSNMTATAAGPSSINLAWTDNSSDETGFLLQRSLSATSGFTNLLTLPANTTSYTNTGLSSATTYYYRVQAINSGGSSPWSNIASATTLSSPPAAPSNLTATASGTSTINLSWNDNSSDETSFNLERSLNSSTGFVTIATLSMNTTSYSNTGLNSSTTYYYRIQAVNATGASTWSNIANATTAAAGPPAAPSNLVATASGCNTIVLNWTDNSSNENNFILQRALSLNGNYTTIASLAANTTTYTNSGLINGKRYYYRVRATNAAGNSSWSNKASAVASCSKLAETEFSFDDILIYPNPVAGNTFTVQLPGETNGDTPVTMRIYSLTGQKIIEKRLPYNVSHISAEELVNGTYIIVLNIGEEIVKQRLIVSK